jgi:selenocysteine-specific elongation factor
MSDRIEAEFRAAGVAPPNLDEAFAKLGLDGPAAQAIAQLLVDGRRLVRIREGLYFHAEPLQAAVGQVLDFLRQRQAITPQEIKDLLGISRKYAIPLLEWLDSRRLTVRMGDKRVLREGAPSGA